MAILHPWTIVTADDPAYEVSAGEALAALNAIEAMRKR